MRSGSPRGSCRFPSAGGRSRRTPHPGCLWATHCPLPHPSVAWGYPLPFGPDIFLSSFRILFGFPRVFSGSMVRLGPKPGTHRLFPWKVGSPARLRPGAPIPVRIGIGSLGPLRGTLWVTAVRVVQLFLFFLPFSPVRFLGSGNASGNRCRDDLGGRPIAGLSQ